MQAGVLDAGYVQMQCARRLGEYDISIKQLFSLPPHSNNEEDKEDKNRTPRVREGITFLRSVLSRT